MSPFPPFVIQYNTAAAHAHNLVSREISQGANREQTIVRKHSLGITRRRKRPVAVLEYYSIAVRARSEVPRVHESHVAFFSSLWKQIARRKPVVLLAGTK